MISSEPPIQIKSRRTLGTVRRLVKRCKSPWRASISAISEEGRRKKDRLAYGNWVEVDGDLHRWLSSMMNGAGERWYLPRMDLAFLEYGQYV